MQTITTILFTVIVLAFLLRFLVPGQWWPRTPRRPVPPASPHRPPDTSAHDDDPPPRRYTGYLN